MSKNVVRDLSLSKNETLKAIPHEVMNKFMKVMLNEITKQNNTTCSINKTGVSSNVGIVYTKDSDKLLKEINIYTAQYLTSFIEDEVKESAKKYYRNLILFESVVTDETLQLHWL